MKRCSMRYSMRLRAALGDSRMVGGKWLLYVAPKRSDLHLGWIADPCTTRAAVCLKASEDRENHKLAGEIARYLSYF
jgi:hypothetical protein